MRVSATGVNELRNHLREARRLELAKRIVRKHTARLQEETVRNAIFTKGYSKGFTKKSILPKILKDGLEGYVGVGTDYSGYVEVGTRFMSAQPFMKPAFERVSEEFLKELERIMK